uniref:IGFBP N-terminal domain-containing protein n=1 Tax=Macrostomum lignano TaxID=282301 RepID=A0A1I8HB66_9PLAT
RSFSIVATEQTPFDCPRPCRCFNQPPQCHAGVTAVRDGCGCCEVCARQLGEDCDERYPCDPAGDLVCARDPSTHVAFCRKRSGGLSCHVNGRVYRDGEAFNSTCRYRCLCQDVGWPVQTSAGTRAASLPAAFAGTAAWCRSPAAAARSGSATTRLPRSLRQLRPASSKADEEEDNDDGVVARKSRHGEVLGKKAMGIRKSDMRILLAAPGTTRWSPKWSACSTTCGVGQSSRLTNDNVECKTIRETRLCMMAECVADPAVEEQRCRSTIRAERPMSLTYTED